jgi:adenylate kinase family enzyme
MMVIIIGMPRSGTTLLGRLIKSSGKFLYIEEPNVIWRYKSWAKLGHEEFLPADASLQNIRYIRRWFHRKLNQSNCQFVLEKTPANIIRTSYIRKIFPDAQFIVLERDLQDVIESIFQKRMYENDKNGVKLGDDSFFRQTSIQISKFLLVPAVDKVFYFRTVLEEVAFKISGRSRTFWGPRYKGWQDSLNLSVIDQCKAQVDHMKKLLESSREDLTAGGALFLNYDELISNPVSECRRIEQYLGIPTDSLDPKIIITE